MSGTKFQDWMRNGKLATVGMVVVFCTWLAFQVFVVAAERPPVLNEVFLLYAGAWVANMSYGGIKARQDSKDDSKDEVGEVGRHRA